MFFKMQIFLFCGLFGFFRTEIKKFLSNFLAFSWPFLICFFDSAIEKSTKFVWFVKDKQFAGWQVLIKSDWSHLSICDESKDAHINWHHKCWIDWLCVVYRYPPTRSCCSLVSSQSKLSEPETFPIVPLLLIVSSGVLLNEWKTTQNSHTNEAVCRACVARLPCLWPPRESSQQ